MVWLRFFLTSTKLMQRNQELISRKRLVIASESEPMSSWNQQSKWLRSFWVRIWQNQQFFCFSYLFPHTQSIFDFLPRVFNGFFIPSERDCCLNLKYKKLILCVHHYWLFELFKWKRRSYSEPLQIALLFFSFGTPLVENGIYSYICYSYKSSCIYTWSGSFRFSVLNGWEFSRIRRWLQVWDFRSTQGRQLWIMFWAFQARKNVQVYKLYGWIWDYNCCLLWIMYSVTR